MHFVPETGSLWKEIYSMRKETFRSNFSFNLCHLTHSWEIKVSQVEWMITFKYWQKLSGLSELPLLGKSTINCSVVFLDVMASFDEQLSKPSSPNQFLLLLWVLFWLSCCELWWIGCLGIQENILSWSPTILHFAESYWIVICCLTNWVLLNFS